MPGRVVGQDGTWGVVEAAGRRLYVPREAGVAVGSRVTMAIRPERLQLAPPDADLPGRNGLLGTVAGQRFVGNSAHLFLEVDQDLSLVVELRPGTPMAQEGESVQVTWRPDEAFVLDEA